MPILSAEGTTRIYGNRSLVADPSNYHLYKSQDLLNSIIVAATRLLQDDLGETIDAGGKLASKIFRDITGLLDPIAKRGGLFPTDGDAGYSVDVSGLVNNIILEAQDIEAVVAAVRISPTAETIQLNLINAALAANV
jgi:hypothetical protein